MSGAAQPKTFQSSAAQPRESETGQAVAPPHSSLVNPSDIIRPKACHGITDGPDVEGLQYMSTITVELEDGSMLRLAVPTFSLMWYVTESDRCRDGVRRMLEPAHA